MRMKRHEGMRMVDFCTFLYAYLWLGHHIHFSNRLRDRSHGLKIISTFSHFFSFSSQIVSNAIEEIETPKCFVC